MKLPKLPFTIQHRKEDTIQFFGLNLTQNTREGEFADMGGLSTSNYPVITQRPMRGQYTTYHDVQDVYVWDGHLYVIDNIYDAPLYKPILKKDGVDIYDIALTSGTKQMAVINSKLVIFPDKVYYDMITGDIVPFVELDWTATTWDIIISGSSETFSLKAEGIASKVKAGDVIDIQAQGLTARRAVVQGVSAGQTPADDAIGLLKSAVTFDPPYSGSLNIKGSFPDLDFICSSGNRIWGCNIEENTIYASALGDPTDFFRYSLGDIGPYAVTVGSEGPFTGICEYNGTVCAWKEKILHKILGKFPSEYYMDDSNIDGLQKGSERSLTVIDQTLYYKGINGVYAYTGGRPQSISYNLGNGIYTNAVGGTDGLKYYIGMTNPAGVSHLYAYDLKHGFWAIEDVGGESYTAMTNKDNQLHMVFQQDGIGKLRRVEQGVLESQQWFGEFVPTYENIFNRKGYLRLLIRMTMTAGSTVTVKVKEDDGAWKTVWQQTAANLVPVMVPVRLGRCDKYTLRLEGTGEVTIRAIGREYVTGSVIN
ncbi:MAG: hypothetical protein IJK86_03840 [Lachnospiraceae bacterium]|nr:hypothetical protein [Clostridia bacterium]MBQ6075266.1 hypothetical protein [Lachnospiraceae bacterium]MBQ6232805.1 hypothetical protein [Clostridia bacterium]